MCYLFGHHHKSNARSSEICMISLLMRIERILIWPLCACTIASFMWQELNEPSRRLLSVARLSICLNSIMTHCEKSFTLSNQKLCKAFFFSSANFALFSLNLLFFYVVSSKAFTVFNHFSVYSHCLCNIFKHFFLCLHYSCL